MPRYSGSWTHEGTTYMPRYSGSWTHERATYVPRYSGSWIHEGMLAPFPLCAHGDWVVFFLAPGSAAARVQLDPGLDPVTESHKYALDPVTLNPIPWIQSP